jgi:hypothetical protein
MPAHGSPVKPDPATSSSSPVHAQEGTDINVIRAHSATAPDWVSLDLLTVREAARELRCSRTHLFNILQGRVGRVPPLPAFRFGRKLFIRRLQLQAWVRSLEDREREDRYASGYFGIPAQWPDGRA